MGLNVRAFVFRQAAAPVFLYPGGGTPRTAILHPVMLANPPARVFRPESPNLSQQVRAHCPEALAGTFSQILGLQRTLGELLAPSHAVVVFSTVTSRLSEEQRTCLWTLFEVPIFEEVLDTHGNLLAWECEAHEGLHLTAAWQEALDTSIVEAVCDCGKQVRRLASGQQRHSGALNAA